MTPTERILAALADHNCDPRRNGKGWSARCPAHDDRRPSLSLSEGDDGRALVNCHAGCPVDAICAAVGLRVADLMANGADVDTTRRPPSKKRVLSAQTFAKAQDAVAELDERMAREKGRRVGQWFYHDASGDPVAVVCRYDLPTPKGEKQEKTFRPVARCGDRWTIGGMSEPRPLYCLPDLASADRVYICEGEKAAEAARSIGLTATTSAHGSQSPEKTNWQPLAAKQCIILPDNDQAGEKYAEAVAAILAKLKPPPVVKVVELPDLAAGGDIADFVEAHDAVESETLRERVEYLTDKAEPIQPNRPAARIERFQPFPTDALPEPIRGFVVAGAKAIGCDPSYLALPLLTALAAAIGNTRRLLLKRGWAVCAIIWAVIVGESGTSKTPAFKLALRPVRDRQRKALEAHAEAMKEYETDLAHYEKNLSAWRRDTKTKEPPPTKPDPPNAARYIVSDTTVEALAPLLLENPRGLLLARDELAGWLGSFDRYGGGKSGADAANWLSLHNGESIVVDRKSGNPRTIFVPQASVSVMGGIQPVILHRALGIEHRESGLAARLLLSCPPRKPKRWTEADIDPNAEAELARLFDRLYDLQPTADDAGDPSPVVVGLTRDAKAAWKEYYNHHAEEQIDLDGELAAAWSKLEEYAARFALVIHYARWAANDATLESPDAVDAASMKAGITLAQWFKAEARRVYALLSESDDDRDQRRLIELIQRRGGSVTPRDLMRSSRQWPTASVAEAALDDLAAATYGRWVEQPTSSKGGRPTRVFKLADSADVDTTPTNPERNGSCVNVNGVNGPDDDWGEL